MRSSLTFEREIEKAKQISGMSDVRIVIGPPPRFLVSHGLEILLTKYGEILGCLRVSDDAEIELSLAQIDKLEELAIEIATKIYAGRVSSTELTPVYRPRIESSQITPL